jgi:phosphoserine aminotransferase
MFGYEVKIIPYISTPHLYISFIKIPQNYLIIISSGSSSSDWNMYILTYLVSEQFIEVDNFIVLTIQMGSHL